jgi:hypothetical protein
MKTRIIKTKFWSDSTVQNSSTNTRILFIYLLTCPFVGLTSYIEIGDGQIKLDTGLTQEQLIKSKKDLQTNKRVFFHNGWVFIPNLDKHNPYWKSPKTEIAYKKEVKDVPTIVIEHFNNLTDSTIHSTMDSTPIVPLIHKTENIKHKKEEYNSKNSLNPCTEEEIKKIAILNDVSFEDAKRTHQIILNKIEAKEFKGKTVYYSLSSWILMGIERGTIKKQKGSLNNYKLLKTV